MIKKKTELVIVRGTDRITMHIGLRYRATYYNGKVIEFDYDGSPCYCPTDVWCSNAFCVTRQEYVGYCTEYSQDFRKVEEV